MPGSAEPANSCKYAFKVFERIGKLAAVRKQRSTTLAGSCSYFSLPLLSHVMNTYWTTGRLPLCLQVSSRLLLQMADADAPLSVIADLTGGGFVHIFIAPLTDIEEEG